MTDDTTSELFARVRAIREREPTGDEIVADLVELHAALPGVTEATLGSFVTPEGKTGYDLLVDTVFRGAESVLELGCGNGPLLERLCRARPDVGAIYGIDPCEPELVRARARGLDERVQLHHGVAQSLALPDASVDVALAHHTFFLFDPVEPAVRELRRVLRPHGLFSFVTTSPEASKYELYTALVQTMSEHTRSEGLGIRRWGDARVWSIDGLSSLFARADDWCAPLDVGLFALSYTEAPAAMCERLAGYFYSVFLQSPATRESMIGRWMELLSARAVNGAVTVEFPLARVTVRRSGSR